MKIIYMGPMEFPDKNAAAHRVLNISKILSELGYEVILISNNKDLDSRKCLYRKTKVNGYECYEFPYPRTKFEWLKRLTSIKNLEIVLGEHNIKSVKAIILYNYYSIASLRIRNLGFRNKIMVIADVTEWYRYSYNMFKNLDILLRMRVVNLRMDALICISMFLYNYYSDRQCRTVYVPALVNANDEKWNNDLWTIPNQIRVVSYVGTPGFQEGKDRVDQIIEAFKLIGEMNINFLLNIVGITKEEFIRFYPRFIDYSFDGIVFHGKVKHSEALNIIKKSDYTVFFRDSNRVTTAGFPTKLGESFACGIPVITNSTGDIPFYLSDGINGFLSQSFDCESLVETIVKALKISDLQLTQMHANCIIKNKLDINEYLETFNGILN